MTDDAIRPRILALLMALVGVGGLTAGCMADDTPDDARDDTDAGFGDDTDPGRETADEPGGFDTDDSLY